MTSGPAAETPRRKTDSLKQLLTSPGLSFLMESHNGLSARIAEEAGFEGIWASGLCVSASMGVRDCNEASWTQVLEVLEFMSDATTVPILLDGDTGYGNFNNVRRLVRKLEQRGIAGVCIEDKLFPKTNSFIHGAAQPLADIEEFCGKIRAGKDSQHDDAFCIVARVEALVAGWGVGEALRRADAYRLAGADAVLIHSTRTHPGEVLAFASEWANRLPVVVVPTTYANTPTEQFERCGISVVIWANHLLRGAAAAMRNVARTVFEQRAVAHVEDQVASVQEIFRLQGVSELLVAEEKYLKASRQPPSTIILAASRGVELGPLTESIPKAMIAISGKPILARLVDALGDAGFRTTTVVAGYKPETITIPGIDLVTNPEHASSKDLASLGFALDRLTADSLITYGDILMRRYILRTLFDAEAPLTVVVDSDIAATLSVRRPGDYVTCTRPDDRSVFGPDVELIQVHPSGEPVPEGELHGQWIGVLRVRDDGREWVQASYDRLRRTGNLAHLSMTDLLNDLVAQRHPIKVIYVHGHWLDVNLIGDIQRANEFTGGLL